MNLNPIREKLAKMFRRNKKLKTKETCCTLSQACSSPSDFHCDFSDLSTIKENLSFCNEQDQFTQALHEIASLRRCLASSKSDTFKLEQRLRDHELLEEFYLQQLKERDQNEKQLKWKLMIVRQELSRQSERSSERYSQFSVSYPERAEEISLRRGASNDY